jgi:uncharacterized protein involved in exopolysaccharide biosynthesis
MLTRGETVALADERIDLKTLWRALVKHKATILVITILCTLAAVVYTMRTTPQYYSSALLQIDRTAQKVVGFNTEVEVDEAPLTEQLRFSTQIALIKSRSLAERVIDELGLYQADPSAHASAQATAALPAESAAGAAVDWTGIALVDKALSKGLHWWGIARARLTSPQAETPAVSRTDALARFEHGLRVDPVRNSRLVRSWQVYIEEPVSTSYKGIEVYKLNTWVQGPVLLQMLNILEPFDLRGLGYNSPNYIHLL